MSLAWLSAKGRGFQPRRKAAGSSVTPVAAEGLRQELK